MTTVPENTPPPRYDVLVNDDVRIYDPSSSISDIEAVSVLPTYDELSQHDAGAASELLELLEELEELEELDELLELLLELDELLELLDELEELEELDELLELLDELLELLELLDELEELEELLTSPQHPATSVATAPTTTLYCLIAALPTQPVSAPTFPYCSNSRRETRCFFSVTIQSPSVYVTV
jgi:hypothetical protein